MPWALLFFIVVCALLGGCDGPGHGSGAPQATSTGILDDDLPGFPGDPTAPDPSARLAGPGPSAPLEPWEVRPGELMAWIRTDDPARADLLDMLSQAQGLAQRLQPRAALVRIHAGEVTGGTVDVRKAGAVTYNFELDEYDKTQPPGKDHVRVAVNVVAGNGKLWAYTHGGTRILRGDLEGQPLAVPCSSRRAWAAAVKSGVPENAVASFHYEAAFVFDPPPRPGKNNRRREWSLRVKGHQELRRSLDPATCEPFAKKTQHNPSPKPTRMPQWPFK